MLQNNDTFHIYKKYEFKMNSKCTVSYHQHDMSPSVLVTSVCTLASDFSPQSKSLESEAPYPTKKRQITKAATKNGHFLIYLLLFF